MDNPKVFISHAHEDKERFVTDFALKLRDNGVDAWYDQWEMSPGDSLVDKIFEEGIKDCDSFLIVLSENSIKKRWVREELDSAVVQRIEKSTKLIPIVLDSDIEIPVSIEHLLRIEINDTEDYDDELKTLLMTLFGVSDKPALGKKPPYAIDYELPGYTKLDGIVLKNIGDLVLKSRLYSTITWHKLNSELTSFSLTEDQVLESLEILENSYILKIKRGIGSKTSMIIQLTISGFWLYAENFVPSFNNDYLKIVSSLVNDNLKSNKEISTKNNIAEAIVDATLEKFIHQGYIKGIKGIDGHILIHDITGSGRRFFRNILS